MLPHKLIRETQKLYDDLFHPSKMKLLIYDHDAAYDEWLRAEQIKCDNKYAYLFVLKLKER